MRFTNHTRRRPTFSLTTAERVARIMQHAGMTNAVPFRSLNGYVVLASYTDAHGIRYEVAPGNFNGVRRVIKRYKRDTQGADNGR